MVRYTCTDMSYVSSNNIRDDDEDLDWTIFDTYYQGFWYLNLNPFEVGLGRGSQLWKSCCSHPKYIFVPSLTTLSMKFLRKPDLLELFPTFALTDHTIKLEVDTCFLRSSQFTYFGSLAQVPKDCQKPSNKHTDI